VAHFPLLPENFETRMTAIMLAAEAEGGSKTWLAEEGCPYRDGEKKLLLKLLSDKEGAEVEVQNIFQGESVSSDLDRFDILLSEIENTISEMKMLEIAVRADDDAAARVQVIKAKTVLLEKWVSLKADVYSMQEMARFQSVVLEMIESMLDSDQRAELIKRLKVVGR